ncbi:hypothetical protein ACQ4PT_036301 [Festuca glaucescens]
MGKPTAKRPPPPEGDTDEEVFLELSRELKEEASGLFNRKDYEGAAFNTTRRSSSSPTATSRPRTSGAASRSATCGWSPWSTTAPSTSATWPSRWRRGTAGRCCGGPAASRRWAGRTWLGATWRRCWAGSRVTAPPGRFRRASRRH